MEAPFTFAVWAVLIVLAWAVFTHMPGRFATPVIVPLALLLGRVVEHAVCAVRPRLLLAALIGFSLAGALLADSKLIDLLRSESSRWLKVTGVPLEQMIDRGDLMQASNPINGALPEHAYVWLIGEARPFYLTPRTRYTVGFSRDPWLEFSAHAEPDAAVAWLRTQGVTHVVFSWSEIERLRRSYGFPAFVTPAWVESLAPSGLRLISAEPGVRGPTTEVYEVVPN